MEFDPQAVSYLYARDPSIISYNFTGISKVRVNLENEIAKWQTDEKEDNNKNLQVFLKIKNEEMKYFEIDNNILTCNLPPDSYTFRNLKSNDIVAYTYQFSKIFGPNSSQEEVFHDIVKPRIVDFFNGKNFTLMSYGASGSGKTFTMVGTMMEPGIIPRSLEYIFRTLPAVSIKEPAFKPLPNGEVEPLSSKLFAAEMEVKSAILAFTQLDHSLHQTTYKAMQQRLSSNPVGLIEFVSEISVSIWVSFVEIYNEHLFDLLKPMPRSKIRPRLNLGVGKNNYIYVKDLSSVCVQNGLEAYQILQYGLHNLNYASTAINSHSSRSHSIFIIKLIQTPKRGGGLTCINTLNFCDLAGSERSKKTLNAGQRLKESNNINKSLLVLSRCINTVRFSQKNKESQPIPFRDSKLTRLFQKALSGAENIDLIINLNPAKKMFDESIHSLNFSAVAKDIKIRDSPMKAIKQTNRFSRYQAEKKDDSTTEHYLSELAERDEEIAQLKEAIDRLYNQLETSKAESDKNLFEEKYQLALQYDAVMQRRHKEYSEKLEAKQQEIIRLKQQLNDMCDDSSDIIEISSSSCEESFSNVNKADDKDKIAQLEDKIKDLEVSKQALEQQLKDSKEIVTKYIEENKELKVEVNKLKGECNAKDILIQDAEKLCDHYEEQLEKERNEKKRYMLFPNLYFQSDLEEEGEETSSENEELTQTQEVVDCSKEISIASFDPCTSTSTLPTQSANTDYENLQE